MEHASSMSRLKAHCVAGVAMLAFVAGVAFAGDPPERRLSHADVQWLQRVTFGLNTETIDRFQALGRARFLDEQLAARDATLPPAIAAQLREATATEAETTAQLVALNLENKRIGALADGDARQAARKVVNDRGEQVAYQAARAELLRAIYSPAQLQEQMTWFWLNHFSVYRGKANLRWVVGDYAEQAIRPHAMGRFRDLVMATLTHPAMIQFLDNAQNAKGHVNENYARELMELHMLGVDAGYTQQDVQQLALILTGVGTNPDPPKLKPAWQTLYAYHDGFAFDPTRHDFSDKTLLGQKIRGSGFDEVEQAVDLIARQPACASFVSRQLAEYFVADTPPPALVEAMARTFRLTDGDIAAVLRTLFESREFDRAMGRKFKDPMQFVVSSMRLAYDGRPIANAHPLVNWLNGLGEPLFGRQTPDGYPLVQSAWDSSGQLSVRFDIARALGSGNAGLFDAENGQPGTLSGFPRIASRLYFDDIEPDLSKPARAALDRANSQQEWNTFLLASPDWNYR
jgi:uncharacterized protein (DUF1800 family)